MNALHDSIMNARIIVCVGSGGVGKTTCSSVIALHAALMGRRTLVLTIDPARRLANSLGLDDIESESLIPIQEQLGLDAPPKGELWAMMLDMKRAFDAVVRRNTESDEIAQRILENKFYQHFSSSLAGTQEYSAIEQLYDISKEDRYDLIVLDTPPTQHTLDFVDAPTRLYEALENSALQWLYRPALASGKIGLGIFKRGAGYIRKTLGRFTGKEMFEDLTVFLQSVSPLLDGFRERAGKVRDILRDETTQFLVVATPEPLTAAEAAYFTQRLDELGVNFGGFIVNRVHEPTMRPGETMPTAEELADTLLAVPGAGYFGRRAVERIAPCVLRNSREFDYLAERDGEMLGQFSNDGRTPVFPVPFYSQDIHTLRGLERVRRDLLDDE